MTMDIIIFSISIFSISHAVPGIPPILLNLRCLNLRCPSGLGAAHGRRRRSKNGKISPALSLKKVMMQSLCRGPSRSRCGSTNSRTVKDMALQKCLWVGWNRQFTDYSRCRAVRVCRDQPVMGGEAYPIVEKYPVFPATGMRSRTNRA